jgi:hypothetical protein
MAIAPAAHRFVASSRHPAANYPLLAPFKINASTPSPRATKETPLPNDVPTILTPMGERRDP